MSVILFVLVFYFIRGFVMLYINDKYHEWSTTDYNLMKDKTYLKWDFLQTWFIEVWLWAPNQVIKNEQRKEENRYK